MSDFPQDASGTIYLDAACQSMRPQPVQAALMAYYNEYNACGERTKHLWGGRVDRQVEAARRATLRFLALNPRHYVVSFTLNTTYGLNLILSQLSPNGFTKIITTTIEHNSVFLPTIALAERTGLPRIVVERLPDGSMALDEDFTGAVVVVSAVSNIDGRTLSALKQLIRRVHAQGGIVIVDAAQAVAHSRGLLAKTEADAVCFSSHKMYGPSLGVMVVRRSLFERLTFSFIGGGMVASVEQAGYQLEPSLLHTRFEAGLQAYGEIIGYGAALEWLETQYKKGAVSQLEHRSQQLYDFLAGHPAVTLINTTSSPTLSFYHAKLDAHLIARVLSDENIMARSGSFCCHYYIKDQQLPPLVRLSLGLHNTDEDVTRVKAVLERVLG